MKNISNELTPEAQIAIQNYINRYLSRLSALIGGLNLFVILAGLFYLYVQGFEIVRIQAEAEVKSAVSKFELNEKLADRLIALGVAEETVRALSERTRSLDETASTLEGRAKELEASLSTVLGVDQKVISSVASLIKNYEKGVDQHLASKINFISDILQTLINRQWNSVVSSRRLGKQFINSRNYPIQIAVTTGGPGKDKDSNSCDLQIMVDGNRIAYSRINSRSAARLCFGFATIPPGSTYEVIATAYPSKGGRIINWHEYY